MSWHVRSLAPGDVHRGVLNEGSVRAACGLKFFSASRSPCSELPPPEQVCPSCLAQTDGQVMITAMCSSLHQASRHAATGT
jgi:hypothetical protein